MQCSILQSAIFRAKHQYTIISICFGKALRSIILPLINLNNFSLVFSKQKRILSLICYMLHAHTTKVRKGRYTTDEVKDKEPIAFIQTSNVIHQVCRSGQHWVRLYRIQCQCHTVRAGAWLRFLINIIRISSFSLGLLLELGILVRAGVHNLIIPDLRIQCFKVMIQLFNFNSHEYSLNSLMELSVMG